MPDRWDLVADIGGTTTRIAAVRNGALSDVARCDSSSREAILKAFSAYAADSSPVRAMIAIAGPLENGRALMVNTDFDMSEAEISAALDSAPTRMINDFDINARLDAAVGKDDQGLYFSIGEAF